MNLDYLILSLLEKYMMIMILIKKNALHTVKYCNKRPKTRKIKQEENRTKL